MVCINAGPIIGYDVFKRRFAWQMDFGIRFFDGHPLLGASKTWRGTAIAFACGAAVAPALGLPARTGLWIALWVVIGDMLSSFVKRRFGRHAGSDIILLDQLPESLFPLLAVRAEYALEIEDMIFMILAFIAVDYMASRFLFKLHLRKHPY